ncbi:Gfo/Idh/MocA family protein [Jannaschia sp. CCS1]|uniref:Gfo/Idh/MocA family protein n=1 Tax=Jannaschia sp. (strain CCS1) TaxID=290400 RepID=UPI000053A3EC|nr:Gfo/Idh/MocA family oxidoreductase [Jannaschia sp. CCS1]ABD57056.1 oxidoreductase-like protein [Jannaschia sp. CCS1]
MNQPISLAICGFGLVGQRHATAAANLPDVQISAVVEPSRDGQAKAAAMGLACFATLDDLFAKQSIDGLIVATPTSLHVEQALAAIALGCPVLVEKPIATSVESAATLVSASVARGVPVLVGHHRRYNPLIQAAYEVIRDGHIGNVRAVNATCWFYKPDAYFDVAPWRKEAGAGPISVNLVHDIDLIRHLCGEVETVSAQAAPSQRGYANEDVAAAVLTLAGGAIATISVSDSVVAPWSWEMTSHEYPVYPQTTESCYLIGGSHGSLSIPDLRVWTHADGQRDWWTPMSERMVHRETSDPLVNQIQHFRDVIVTEAEPRVPAEEGLRTLRVIDAMQRSAKTGKPIHLRDAASAKDAAE